MNQRQANAEALGIAYRVLSTQDAIGIGDDWTYEDGCKVEAAFDRIVQSMYERSQRAKERLARGVPHIL